MTKRRSAISLSDLEPLHTGPGRVVPPYGRCRLVLLDCFPALKVIVGTDARTRTVRITDLLPPESYDWAGHQLDAE
ncbi:hypothetical protein [Streptomyces sp. NPDC058307]|uniref:hypothetical protein n=1 Tax=Streptomyces sp. NPDC058307 TaxID=3346439 RepID=UPI0036EB8F2F